MVNLKKKKIFFFLITFFFQESSSFAGQFQQQGQLSYADSVGYYGDDLVNGVEHLQQHHSQNYSHLQQRKKTLYFKSIH